MLDDSRPSEPALVKGLHFFMILLCGLATLVLLSSNSTTVKLLISLLLILYTAFLLVNSATIQLVFKLGDNQGNPLAYQVQSAYRHIKLWNIQAESKRDPPSLVANADPPSNTNFMWRRPDN